MSLEIIRYPHPTLRYPSKPIQRVDRELVEIAHEMLDLMYAAKGVGLAANQVNIPLRMFVANPSGVRGEGEEIVVLNPEIQRPKGTEAEQEGCLSLPQLYGTVKRPRQIDFSAYDIHGKSIEGTIDGFLARVLMHEADHLNGVLFFDRMADEAVRELQEGLDEFVSDFRNQQSTGAIAQDSELLAGLAEWEQRYA